MEKQPAFDAQRKSSRVRPWHILVVFLIGGLVIGSWIVTSSMMRQQPLLSTVKGPAMIEKSSQDVYTAYNDVVYKLSERSGSVVWKFALKQAYKPNRSIGSYLQLNVVNDVVYAALEYGVYALRASDGKELWYYTPQLTKAELAQDRGRIVKVYMDKSVMYLDLTRGDMSALDLRDGKLKWDHLSFPNGGNFSAANDTLYVSETSSKNVTTLHAIDGLTGKERWHFQREFINSSLSTTFVFGDIVYSSGNPLYALDVRTAKKLWEQRLPLGAVFFADLTARNGVLYANTNAFADMVGGQETPLDNYRVFAFDPLNGKQLWISQPGYLLRNEVIDGGKSLLVESTVQKGYRLQVLDAKTGAVKWQPDLGCNRPQDCTQVVTASDNRLYVLSQEQTSLLRVFDIETGKQLEQRSLTIPIKEAANLGVLDGDTLYIRSSVHEGDEYYSGSSTSFIHYTIYAIGLNDGKTNWKYDMGSLVEYQVPVTDIILASSRDRS